MPFGIPSEDFHDGFGLPRADEECSGSVGHDDYDPYTGKYAFCPPMTDKEFAKAYKDYMNEYRTDDDDDASDEEYEAAAQEAHDELVRSLIEAGGEIREARELLARSLEMLYLLGYDSGFTNSEISTLTTDIKKFLEETG